MSEKRETIICTDTLIVLVVIAELKMRTEALQVTLDDVMTNAEAVQADLEATSYASSFPPKDVLGADAHSLVCTLISRDLEDLDACEQDAEHGHARIEELVHAGESSKLFVLPRHRFVRKPSLIHAVPLSTVTDSGLLAQCFEELSVCDAEHRDRIRFLIERKVTTFRVLASSILARMNG